VAAVHQTITSIEAAARSRDRCRMPSSKETS
jgi:hypothetical protein